MRVLIFSADIGEGHDLPARVLANRLRSQSPDVEIEIVDTIAISGKTAQNLMRNGMDVILDRMPWIFDLQYWIATKFPPTHRFALFLLNRASTTPIMRAIVQYRPDVVVSTYPAAAEVLGTLRLSGKLNVPVVSAITDLAGLKFWAHQGCDLHLVTHAESAAEVRDVAGEDARIEHVKGLTDPAFERRRDSRSAKTELGLHPSRRVVLVSGGGWGVGDLVGAVQAVLDIEDEIEIVALCGRSKRAQERLNRRFGADDRVHIIGFTDRMSDYMAAADVLVHSTAGLTVLEALVSGVKVISYGWGIAHIRLNNVAYEEFGLAKVANNELQLTETIKSALADTDDSCDDSYPGLPDAADVVADLALEAVPVHSG